MDNENKIKPDVPFNELIRNVEKYEGFEVHGTGFIFQILYDDSEKSEWQMLGIAIDDVSEIYWTTINYDDGRFLKGDDIEFWGNVNGVDIYNNPDDEQVIALKINHSKIKLIKK